MKHFKVVNAWTEPKRSWKICTKSESWSGCSRQDWFNERKKFTRVPMFPEEHGKKNSQRKIKTTNGLQVESRSKSLLYFMMIMSPVMGRGTRKMTGAKERMEGGRVQTQTMLVTLVSRVNQINVGRNQLPVWTRRGKKGTLGGKEWGKMLQITHVLLPRTDYEGIQFQAMPRGRT